MIAFHGGVALCPSQLLLIGYAPDRAVAIFCQEQGAVFRNSQPDGSAPYVLVGDHETGDEVLILASRLAFFEQHAHDLVARTLASVPRSMQGNKCIPSVFGREIFSVIKSEPKGGGMRLKENVWHRHLIG